MILRIPKRTVNKNRCIVCDGSGLAAQTPSRVILLSCSNCEGKGYKLEEPDYPSSENHILFYIDQNIISEMRQRNYQIPNHRMFDLSQQGKHRKDDFVIYVYSNETIAEISRTRKPQDYLDELKELKAQKLLEYIDIQNPNLIDKPATHTGKLQPLLHYIDPDIFYEYHQKRINTSEEYISDVVLFSNMVLHVASLIKMNPVKFELVDLRKNEKLQELANIIVKIRNTLGTTNVERVILGKQQNPIDYLWEKIIKPKLKNPDITDNIFFSFLRSESVSSDIVNLHIILNIIGYYPDKTKKVISNIPAFMSDVRHVNIALRTDVFLTYDHNLAHRAAAICKWENSKTGYNMMTVFKRFGKKDIENYIKLENETADQANDRSVCLFTAGELIYTD